jgi:phenylacetate-CoA ligase
MVVTTLCKEAVPLIRYRTRDITRIIPGSCTCGTIMPRHSRIRGRTDDMFKFRAVNIYPSTIDAIVSGIPDLGSEYQIHLSRDASERGIMRLVVERARDVGEERNEELSKALVHHVKKKVLITPVAEIVPYGSLPRSERKSKRVFDMRIEDSIV